MKISNLLDKDLKIVEKKKIFFLIPVAVVVIAAVCMLIYGLVLGSPLNLGMDFTGGYTLDVRLGTKLTASNTDEYKDMIVEIVEGLENGNGKPYGLKVAGIQTQGNADTAALRVTYNAVADSTIMDEEINPKISQALQDAMFRIVPSVSVNTENNQIIFDYEFSLAVDSLFDQVKNFVSQSLADNGVTVESAVRSDDKRSMTVTCASVASVTDAVKDSVRDAATINDKYSGLVSTGNTVSASFSAELLWSAFAAILASVVLMLIYIAFRFELTSGISAIVALFHDILIMFCFMAIFRIPINSTFIAALITILGYSINNTIIIFDRVRENQKSMFAEGCTAAFIANKSVTETLWRSVNTTLTTLLTIGMVAILGVPDIKIFALPIIIGLLAGTYSSIFISPSIWASWKGRKKKGARLESKKDSKKAVAV